MAFEVSPDGSNASITVSSKASDKAVHGARRQCSRSMMWRTCLSHSRGKRRGRGGHRSQAAEDDHVDTR